MSMQLAFPGELGPADEFCAELEAMVREIEENAAAERRRTGKRVLGRAAVLKQSWRSNPTTFEPRRVMSPRIAACNVWARVEALGRNREFVREHAKARALWRAGFTVTFPPGTYWLRRFAGVPVAEA